MESQIKPLKLNIKDISYTLFESAAEGLVVVDKMGVINIINPRIEEMFGYTREELIGKPLETLMPDKYRSQHLTHRANYNAYPSKRSMGKGIDLTAKRKDGSTFSVEISLNNFNVDGEAMTIALISDITERKIAEDALKKLNTELEERVAERTRELEESQKLYRIIARNYPNGIINVFDKNLDYVFAEGMDLYKIGITSEELRGTNYLERLPETIRQHVKRKLLSVFKGKNCNFEISANKRTYMIDAVGLRDAEGEIQQILVVQTNITQLKKAEEGIKKALKKEKYLNELKSRFVSMASHEFRTPLTSILSSASLLEKYIESSDNKEKQHKHLTRIKASVHLLTDILNDFLSLDMLEEGKVDMHYSNFNLPKFLEELVEELQEITKRGQSISYHHEGEEQLTYDKQILKNILNNLLSNAIKYSKENGEVLFSTELNDGTLVITIKDHGIGIPEEEQEHLFERFFRANNVTSIQGTGLGLNIVKKYVDIVKGDILFESKIAEGTTFTIKLPINKN